MCVCVCVCACVRARVCFCYFDCELMGTVIKSIDLLFTNEKQTKKKKKMACDVTDTCDTHADLFMTSKTNCQTQKLAAVTAIFWRVSDLCSNKPDEQSTEKQQRVFLYHHHYYYSISIDRRLTLLRLMSPLNLPSVHVLIYYTLKSARFLVRFSS